MSQPLRVKKAPLINSEATLHFTFDGERYEGCEGDSLASALLANDVHLMGRSFKYHRPRGVMSAGPEEANALFGLRRGPGRFEPNNRATMVELYDGLACESQNRWPNLRADVGQGLNWFSRFIPAGFYYKTFMWPRWAWKHLYEPAIRATAGLGDPTRDPDPDQYTNRYE